MQEDGRFAQEAIERTRVFRNNRLGQPFQFCLLFETQILARVNDDRQLLQLQFSSDFLDYLDAGNIRQAQIQHQAVKVLRFQGGQSFPA